MIDKLRSDLPLWVLGSVFALITILGYIGLHSALKQTTVEQIKPYDNIVKLTPTPANLTIILP